MNNAKVCKILGPIVVSELTKQGSLIFRAKSEFLHYWVANFNTHFTPRCDDLIDLLKEKA